MSSIGLGATVFAGMMIGMTINHPEMPFDVLFTGSAMWGLLVGFVFRLYQIALKGWSPPSFRNR